MVSAGVGDALGGGTAGGCPAAVDEEPGDKAGPA